VTPIIAAPFISSTKIDTLFTDVDRDGATSPGDVLLYTITIRNSGNAAASGITLTDVLDSNTSLIVGTVQTSQGSVTKGNTAGDTSVGVDIGTIPGQGGSVSVSYLVRINNPLPPGVTQVANQGIVSGTNTPGGPTDDPRTPPTGDPTITPVRVAPRITASKVAKLFVDADNNHVTSPGDTLVYQITIQNTGNAAETGMKFNDIPDINTRLVVGSVHTSQGSVTSGNASGDTSVGVNIGTVLGGGATVTISFLVTINKPLQGGLIQVRNQGVVTGDTGPAVPTDDPTTPTPGDPTITPTIAAPALAADKSVSLFADPDNNGLPSPGDTLLYQIAIQNTGNAPATGVAFSDTPDANTRLVSGSVKASQGTVSGGNAGVPPVTVNLGTLPSGARATITFRVTIDNPLPPGVTQVANQGTLSSNELQPVPTNDPNTPPAGDPTITPISAAPVLSADKVDILFVDTNHSGAPGAGDTLLYIITIANKGNIAATGVTFTDTPDVITKLIVGTVRTNHGTVTKGNSAGDTSVAVNIGVIPAGDIVIISFQVRLSDPLPRQFISNQGTVAGPNLPPLPTNDPDTPAPGDPTVTIIPPNEVTAVSLASFTAVRQANGVMVRWVTTAELNTWGFYLYRSADGSRAHAARVTPEIILGQGRGQGGASYSWLDRQAQPGTLYTYWLQEVELNGAVNEYGPATAVIRPSSQRTVSLPVAHR
jgi:uncharacterized repeat protein (TIGR01451 family)